MVAQVLGPNWIGTLFDFVYLCLIDDEIECDLIEEKMRKKWNLNYLFVLRY